MRKAPKARQLASHGPEVVAQVRMAGDVIAQAGPSYDKRWNELAALVSAVAMDDTSRAEIIGLMDLLYTIRLVHLEAEKVIRDVASLTMSKEAEIVKGVQRTRGGRKTGQGKKKEAERAHTSWIDQARKAIASGTAPRDLSGILAKRYTVTPKTMRKALQDSGLVPRRKS